MSRNLFDGKRGTRTTVRIFPAGSGDMPGALTCRGRGRDTGGMVLQVLDPTNETAPPLGQPAPRLPSLAGATVGFISNGKEGTAGFFNHLDRILRERFGVADVVRRVKSNYSAPADADIVDELRRWQAVVTGVGD